MFESHCFQGPIETPNDRAIERMHAHCAYLSLDAPIIDSMRCGSPPLSTDGADAAAVARAGSEFSLFPRLRRLDALPAGFGGPKYCSQATAPRQHNKVGRAIAQRRQLEGIVYRHSPAFPFHTLAIRIEQSSWVRHRQPENRRHDAGRVLPITR